MMIKISWEEVERAVAKISDQINKENFEADCIIGITTGGIVPMGLLVKKLETKQILTISAKSYEKEKQGELVITYLPEVDLTDKKILVVDEIADTGKTLKEVSRILRTKYNVGVIKTASLIVNKNNCNFLPDFFATSVDKWVVFPWDQDEFLETI